MAIIQPIFPRITVKDVEVIQEPPEPAKQTVPMHYPHTLGVWKATIVALSSMPQQPENTPAPIYHEAAQDARPGDVVYLTHRPVQLTDNTWLSSRDAIAAIVS